MVRCRRFWWRNVTVRRGRRGQGTRNFPGSFPPLQGHPVPRAEAVCRPSPRGPRCSGVGRRGPHGRLQCRFRGRDRRHLSDRTCLRTLGIRLRPSILRGEEEPSPSVTPQRRSPPAPGTGLAQARTRAGWSVCGLAEALRGHGQALSWAASPMGTEACAGLGTGLRGKPGPPPPRAERPRPSTPPPPSWPWGPRG